MRPALPILTSLRFFAAAEVVAYHIVTTHAGDAVLPDGFFKSLASGGFAAVGFFFVLSGFILTYVHAGQTDSDDRVIKPTMFWRLRFARIAPAYFLGLIMALPSLINFLHDPAMPAWERVAGPILVVLFLQAWWSPLAMIWNYPAWSLSVECLFYALFPWLARASVRLPRSMLFLIAYCLIVAATAYREEFLSLPGAIPLPCLPHFIFGMVLGRQYLFGPTISPRLHAAMFYLGVGLLAIVFCFDWLLPWWTRSDAVLVSLFALIIFGGARPTGAGTLLTLPVFVLLGEASYSMYILHAPLRHWWEGMGIRPSALVESTVVFWLRGRSIDTLVSMRRDTFAQIDRWRTRPLRVPSSDQILNVKRQPTKAAIRNVTDSFRFKERFDEGPLLRFNDRVAIGAQSSHSGGSPINQRE